MGHITLTEYNSRLVRINSQTISIVRSAYVPFGAFAIQKSMCWNRKKAETNKPEMLWKFSVINREQCHSAMDFGLINYLYFNISYLSGNGVRPGTRTVCKWYLCCNNMTWLNYQQQSSHMENNPKHLKRCEECILWETASLALTNQLYIIYYFRLYEIRCVCCTRERKNARWNGKWQRAATSHHLWFYEIAILAVRLIYFSDGTLTVSPSSDKKKK